MEIIKSQIEELKRLKVTKVFHHKHRFLNNYLHLLSLWDQLLHSGNVFALVLILNVQLSLYSQVACNLAIIEAIFSLCIYFSANVICTNQLSITDSKKGFPSASLIFMPRSPANQQTVLHSSDSYSTSIQYRPRAL